MRELVWGGSYRGEVEVVLDQTRVEVLEETTVASQESAVDPDRHCMRFRELVQAVEPVVFEFAEDALLLRAEAAGQFDAAFDEGVVITRGIVGGDILEE